MKGENNEMKKDRKLFNFWEKVVVFSLSLAVVFLIIQVASLYKDRNTEVSTKAEQTVSSEQAIDEKIDSAEAKNVETEQNKQTKKESSVNDKQKNENTKNKDNHDKQKSNAKTAEAKQEQKQPPPKGKVAYLTIDDGPTEVEHELLDLLASYNAKATFFMLEPYMKKYPDAVKRIVDEGHVAALHGVTHNAKKFYRSKDTVLNEMNQAQKTLENITGYRATLIRTPYGSSPKMTPEYKQAVKENGYQLWDWNVDSRDWKYTDGSFVAYSIQQIEKLAEKGEDPIILLHSKRTTLEHLPKLLDYLVEQGYSFEVLTESLEPYQLP